jgi:two-component system, cell cycle sensor histidine kinase PleC
MRFIMLDLFFGMAWTFILIHPIGADEQSGTFMLFVMLLVVAISSMLASSLPVAVFALTLPVTMAIALDFVFKGTLRDYILAIMALAAEGYFSLLAYRLYSTTLATLEARAEKDALIGELEQSKSISDEARRRGRQHRQVAFSRADEPRAAHPAQRHPRLLRGDEGRDLRAAYGACLQGLCRRHP